MANIAHFSTSHIVDILYVNDNNIHTSNGSYSMIMFLLQKSNQKTSETDYVVIAKQHFSKTLKTVKIQLNPTNLSDQMNFIIPEITNQLNKYELITNIIQQQYYVITEYNN